MNARGQAVVELALGLLVFVTVLLFAVQFAELGHLALKVDEVAASALWETTAKPLHALPGDFTPARRAVSAAGAEARLRYQRLEGATLALSAGSRLESTCTEVPLPSPAVASARAVYGGAPLGLSCRASLTTLALRVPRTFASELFGAEHVARPSLTFCAGSRACAGSYTLLLDDLALTGPAEGAECALGACTNTGYHESVRALFDAHGRAQGSAGSALAILVVGRTPYDENRFHMSFRGEESGFIEWKLPGGEGTRLFPTSPGDVTLVRPLAGRELGYHDAYWRRTGCFLGRGC